MKISDLYSYDHPEKTELVYDAPHLEGLCIAKVTTTPDPAAAGLHNSSLFS